MQLAVITGPTATGKTALGARLAQMLDGEVVSADSMQIYRLMDIGTAKPTAEEMLGVPHHMIDVISPFDSYSVSRYAEEASKCVDDIIARGKMPIIVGGTGLYIDALISGTIFALKPDEALRSSLCDEYDALGGDEMLRRLAEFDRESAEKLASNDKRRIVRAFEIFRLTGMTKTQHDEYTKTLPPRYEAKKLALTFKNRQDLYDRIDRRVDIMMERGLEREVRSLLDMGLSSDHTAMQAIGYKELVSAISGECSVSEAVDTIKRESRRYAKRQLSWLRRDSSVHWIEWSEAPDISSGLQDSTKFLFPCE